MKKVVRHLPYDSAKGTVLQTVRQWLGEHGQWESRNEFKNTGEHDGARRGHCSFTGRCYFPC